ncbi:MAG: phage holin family protein [Chloroflexia bacterium]|nr:phage holin family protein [Chloroflexia bacterium]
MDTGTPPTSRPGAAPGMGNSNQANPEGLGSLVTGIVEDLQGIVRGEVLLAKTELKEDVSVLGKAAGSLVAGGVVAFVGFIFLMLGVTYVLNQWLEMWLAAGIVGIALLLIGGILVMSGKKAMSAASMKPTETIDSLKEDQEWANQQIKSVKK